MCNAGDRKTCFLNTVRPAERDLFIRCGAAALLYVVSLLCSSCRSTPDSQSRSVGSREVVNRSVESAGGAADNEGAEEAPVCAPTKRSMSPPQNGTSCTCGVDAPWIDKNIAEVSIVSNPKMGTAVRDVYSNGCVHGGHVGGGPTPMGSNEFGCVSEACVKAVWKLAEAGYDEMISGKVPKGPETECFSISIKTADKQIGRSWAFDQKPPTQTLDQLSKLLSEMEIGHW